eukprot:6913302-Alexandrium_andersonii.AAC.2
MAESPPWARADPRGSLGPISAALKRGPHYGRRCFRTGTWVAAKLCQSALTHSAPRMWAALSDLATVSLCGGGLALPTGRLGYSGATTAPT